MSPIEVKFIGKYVGPDKIVSIEVSDFTTPLGSAVFEVVFESGLKTIFPEKALVAVSTEEAKDHTFVRDRRFTVMMPDLINLVKEYDVPGTQVNNMLQVLAQNIDNEFGRALNYFWTNDDSRFVPGYSPMNDATLLMASQVISVIPNKADDSATE